MNILNLEGLKVVGQVAPNTIINADCLEAMKYIADKSIDCIICDLPYGITACKWDTVIPFEPLWEQYKRIIKPRGAIALFGSQPFTSALVISNPRWFKYEWIWKKNKPSGALIANKRPMRNHETILIFYSSQPTFNKILEQRECNEASKKRLEYEMAGFCGSNTYQTIKKQKAKYDPLLRNPTTVKSFSLVPNRLRIHPTQKPVALIEYLIKTYTLKGELILDNTAGSGTLAIAAINTDRNYICIEKDEHYFEVMRVRIENHDPNAIKPQPKLPKKKPVNDEYIQLSLFNDCLNGL